MLVAVFKDQKATTFQGNKRNLWFEKITLLFCVLNFSVAGTTVIVEQPAAAVGLSYGPTPVATTCPGCGSRVTTTTTSYASSQAWIACLIICLFG